jgi:hypothetical protein
LHGNCFRRAAQVGGGECISKPAQIGG